MLKNDFQIEPVFEECTHSGGEPNLEQLIYNHYRRYFDSQKAFIYTQRYIDTLITMKDPAGVM